MSRIFVTGTGRCGSLTFSKACAHVTNYTAGHETHTNKRDEHGRMVGDILNLKYPDNHIEVSPQLAIQIPLLRRRYPEAKWVHLVRNDGDACARSLRLRSDMRAFARYNFLCDCDRRDEMAVACAVYDTMRTVIDACLERAAWMPFRLEQAKEDWPDFWAWIHAAGDFGASLAEWDHHYNKGTI